MTALAATNPSSPASSSTFWKLTIGVIGVVYGDIGTSPIYAFREAMHTLSGASTAPVNDVLGILSLIIWALMVIVTIKYVLILLRADNAGEGGTLALMTLVRRLFNKKNMLFVFLGMAGAALFYGDSIITPALSVLSAVEGLEVVSPQFTHFILPITTTIIVLLFMFQSKGTGKVSALFGPIVIVWFGVLGTTGAWHIIAEPVVLESLNPVYAAQFLMAHGGASFLTLGAVFLAVTGAEALYADLGHFGKKPIQFAWLWFVFPALALNYLGQGALVLHDPSTADNPFFKMVPDNFLIPLVILSTLATIIASQAVITGAYSITQQAVNLGFLPRMTIKQTSDDQLGQIYMPRVNYVMMIGVLFLVFTFKSSSNLATAYGISVTGTMVITAIMLFFVVWKLWKKPLAVALLAVAPFVVIDGIFLGSNLLKVLEGGWMALAVAGFMMMLMYIWVRGTFILTSRDKKRQMSLEKFLREYPALYPGLRRVKGTAFFLTATPDGVPHALALNMQHNKTLHEKNVILTVDVEQVPAISENTRVTITRLADDMTKVHLRFGFKELPDIQGELLRLQKRKDGLDFDWENASVFLSRKTLRAHSRYGLPFWQDLFYTWMYKNATDPTDFYRLPIGRVIELGRHAMI